MNNPQLRQYQRDVINEFHRRVVSWRSTGAYVQWVPDRQIVVVRYLPPTPPPSAPPAPPPTTPPTAPPTPTPTPVPHKNIIFIAGDYQFAGKTYNEFSGGFRSSGSWNARGNIEYDRFVLGADYSQYRYPHNCAGLGDSSCNVRVVGGNGTAFVPEFTARDTFTEAHLGYEVTDDHAYPLSRVAINVAWEFNSGNYGYPNMTGVGFGLEKFPDPDHSISWWGSYYYYPNTRGTYSGLGQSLPMQYSLQTYKIGATFAFSKPIWFEVGYFGNRGNAKANSPLGYTHNGIAAGLGFNFSP